MKASRASRLFLVAAALAGPGALGAQAFGLNEIGSCAIARGFATTASPCRDASAIYWNPAATTMLSGWNVVAGVTAISIKGNFQQDTTGRTWDADVPTQWVPHAFVSYHGAGRKWAFGVGAYVPYGLTSQWTDSFPGRFSAKKATLKDLYVQPNIAWQITPNWSIGGGPVYGYSSVELVQALDLSTQPVPGLGVPFSQLGIATGTEFARARLKGSASAWGAQVGIQGRFNRDWSVGARYLSPISFKYDDADATFTPVTTGLTVGGTLQAPFTARTPIDALLAPQFTNGALVAQKVSTEIKNPAQVQAGIAFSGVRNWLFEADYSWVGWSSFQNLPINFQGAASSQNRSLIEDYQNSSGIRLGAEYTIPTDGWRLRAGFAGAQSAAPEETVTPLLPEQDRAYGTFGIGIPFMKTWMLDGSYAHVFTGGRRGRIAERSDKVNPTATAAQLNTGVFNLSANIFSLTIKANF